MWSISPVKTRKERIVSEKKSAYVEKNKNFTEFSFSGRVFELVKTEK